MDVSLVVKHGWLMVENGWFMVNWCFIDSLIRGWFMVDKRWWWWSGCCCSCCLVFLLSSLALLPWFSFTIINVDRCGAVPIKLIHIKLWMVKMKMNTYERNIHLNQPSQVFHLIETAVIKAAMLTHISRSPSTIAWHRSQPSPRKKKNISGATCSIM